MDGLNKHLLDAERFIKNELDDLKREIQNKWKKEEHNRNINN